MSATSPLLHSQNSPRGSETVASDVDDGENNDVSIVDLHSPRRFSQSTHRSSFASFSDSVGRRGFINGIFTNSGHNINDFDLSDEEEAVGGDWATFDDNFDVYSPFEATQLAREQQTLLADNNIDYDRYGTLAADHPNQPDLSQARQEVLDTNIVWDEAVKNDRVHTTVRRELIVLSNNSFPLTLAFLLQFSLPVASVFSVGHLGTSELGAVSLASMTANITGFAMIQGFATCLDTLCPQAFGAGKLHQVGVYYQKCVSLILICFIPIGLIWFFSEPLIALVVDEREVARLAALYLRTVVWGAPGYTLFECGKRFVYAQGIFHASTVVLVLCAPFNAIMNYTLVWNKSIGIGYQGAPIAVCLTNWLMPIMLGLYVRFVDGRQCWGGISPDIFRNWGPMFRLAIPGFIMIEAEFLAYEILTFVSTQFGSAALAAQAVLTTVTSLTYQIPFAVAIAVATRVANFVGATLIQPAKLAGRIGIFGSYAIAVFNGLLMYFFRYQIGNLFSNDPEVIKIVADALPICSVLQLADSPGVITGGVLRGQGRQYIAGYLNLVCYYLIALPLGFVFAFKFNLNLAGLWFGMTIGLFCVVVSETYYVARSNWKQIISDASERDRDERIVTSQ